MHLISLEAISRNYTPIILWLQEVDEQVRTDSEVKVGGLLLMMRKSTLIFMLEGCGWFIALLKALMHSCRTLSLIFAKRKILFLAQKLLSLA